MNKQIQRKNFFLFFFILLANIRTQILSLHRKTEMVVVAQLVRALDCGSRGRRFEPDLPPQKPQLEITEAFSFLYTLLLILYLYLI